MRPPAPHLQAEQVLLDLGDSKAGGGCEVSKTVSVRTCLTSDFADIDRDAIAPSRTPVGSGEPGADSRMNVAPLLSQVVNLT